VARAGVPLTLSITIQNLTDGSCSALSGAYVDIWHCDAKGIYSDEPTYNPGGGTGSVNTTGQKFLRGYQITDANGTVSFTTIYPGWYQGRTIHIHFRVRTYSGTTVLSNVVSQIFFDDTVSNTVLSQSAYSRSTARDTTNTNDMVYQVANKERMLATLSGNVNDGYTAAITAGAALVVPAVASPTVLSNGVGNAFSGAAGIAPGSWISIYGANFATATIAVTSADLVNNALPTSLGGFSSQINGKPAFVQYVSPTQANVLAPADSSVGPVAVSVSNQVGASNSVTATLQPVLPGLLVSNNYVRAVRYPDEVIINGTGAAETGYVTSAAVGAGEIVSLYGTGFGPTDLDLAPGVVFTGEYPTNNPVAVSVGGMQAEVLWAGLVGLGVYQINIQLPAALADGDQPVVATVAGISSQSSALIKIAVSAKLSAGASLLARLWQWKKTSRYAQSSLARLQWLGGLNARG
jgi:uncharacterized protein (TIGR03437 family)